MLPSKIIKYFKIFYILRLYSHLIKFLLFSIVPYNFIFMLLLIGLGMPIKIISKLM